MKKNLVVLTGAGISAESGLKTFRDSDGLWEGHRVEEVATATAWRRNPALVQEFYNARRKQLREVKPNEAHKILAELEQYFNVIIITQNVDDLHERAGSHHIIHLHGELLKMRSELDEHTHYPVEEEIRMGQLAPDGGQLRPHIVFFEEMVPKMEEAAAATAQADIFLVVGTSLVVYPAAGLVNFAPPQVPVYIVDRKIPACERAGVISIELPATQGMRQLREELIRMA